VKIDPGSGGHATASITPDTYGHLFPSRMEALANRLELVRDAALAKQPLTQYGPSAKACSEGAVELACSVGGG
jgi:hypothetical protein